jgi:hypothetical protein
MDFGCAISASSLSMTERTSINSMTPGRSIFLVQGISPAGLPYTLRAASSYRSTHHSRL